MYQTLYYFQEISMTVCGIVAEYNPFHTGHAHHIAQTQRALGGEAAIV